MAVNETGVCPNGDFRALRRRNSQSMPKLLLVTKRKFVHARSIGAKFDYIERPRCHVFSTFFAAHHAEHNGNGAGPILSATENNVAH